MWWKLNTILFHATQVFFPTPLTWIWKSISNGSLDNVSLKCRLNCSFRSLETPISWNILWSLLVYSNPHAYWKNKNVFLIQLKRLFNFDNISKTMFYHRKWNITDLFQLWNHRSLCVVTSWHMLYQTLCKHFAIKFLKYILVFDIFENYHLRMKRLI